MQNVAFGWCAITALGNYDYTKGGHLILWDLGLVIEFPPGSTILIPSACVKHSNVSIGDDETRFSIVQYAAGEIFHWSGRIFDGVQSFKYDTRAAKKAGKERAEYFVGLFSTEEELKKMYTERAKQ